VQAWRSAGAREAADAYDDVLDLLLLEAARGVAGLGHLSSSVTTTALTSTGTDPT
jgi:hypothetical protein